MKQAEASRINGARSNGPSTPEGRAISSRNARTHGLTGGDVVLPHESQEQYDALLASFVKRFRPTDETEFDLIREMVNSRWRLRRIESMEVALIQRAVNQQMEAMGNDADPAEAQSLAYAELAENSKGLRLLNRYAKDLRRSYEKALAEFMELQCGDLCQIPESREAQSEPDYTALRNEPDSHSAGFMKAIQPYVKKQEAAFGRMPLMKNAA